jgi:FkbM family methyltransferase
VGKLPKGRSAPGKVSYVKPRQLADSLYRRWQEIRKPQNSEYSGIDEGGYYFVTDDRTGNRVYVSHPRRLAYYREGVAQRVSNLAREYCLDGITLGSSDQLIDVGAHSGEFGLWAQQFGSAYLGIEPDPIAFGALHRNLPEARLEQVAVGADRGTAEFSLATSTGDSSFDTSGGQTIKVRVETLDDVAQRVFPEGHITILKIEAEGFEPEVLEGASATLSRTRIVTVDAGEERGGLSTAPDCVNLLISSGFQLTQVYLRRGIFLFQSTSVA